MSICPCPNCRESASAIHSGLGWLLLIAAASVAVRYAYTLIESIAWALLIPTAVIAAVMVAVVARMVLKKPAARAVPPPAPRVSVASPPASAATADAILAPLDARLADLIRAKASAN